MVLVDYPSSDDSEGNSNSVAKAKSENDKNLPKPTFQKVVDRSNSHKIRVHLPDLSNTANDSVDNGEEPLAKRIKTGSKPIGNFNSLLPPPKRVTGMTGILGSTTSGLRSGASLKTGAAPSLNRELSAADNGHTIDHELVGEIAQNGPELDNSVGQSQSSQASNVVGPSEAGSKPPKTPIMFKPLSVARKSKKCKLSASSSQANEVTQEPQHKPQLISAPKIALFGTGAVGNLEDRFQNSREENQLMEFETPFSYLEPITSEVTEHLHELESAKSWSVQTDLPIENGQRLQSLDSIAEDLNLSASAKRQLFGRQKNEPSTISIVNFSTDQEYAANELLRQAGEQIQHNPVRTIAPGKHSLKQLVNVANSQKDALEEHFATSRRNKKESGSKYGW